MFRAFKKHSLVVVVSLIAVATAQSPSASIVGDYTGVLGPLHLMLHVQQGPSGALTGTLVAVEQSSIGLQRLQPVVSGNHFSFALAEAHATYKGEISSDGNTITGTWDQGQPRPLVFTRKTLATAASLAPTLAQIDTSTAAAFDKNPVGSVTVGVVSGPQLIWTKSYGNAEMQKHVAADKDTVYRIGSITKMFTAVMLEQLVDAGKVHLSDPVEKYFPEVNKVQGRYPGAPPITLVELATHTSGLDREPEDTAKYVQGRSPTGRRRSSPLSRSFVTGMSPARAFFTRISGTQFLALPCRVPQASLTWTIFRSISFGR